MSLLVINNFFNSSEIDDLQTAYDTSVWKLKGKTNPEAPNTKVFWWKNLLQTSAAAIFKNVITKRLNNSIEVFQIYINGQSHGQDGSWHVDAFKEESPLDNYFTLVYFPLVWDASLGGHLCIKDEREVHSILPEYNKAVIFNSTYLHIGLGPTSHCMTQRESVACKFKVL